MKNVNETKLEALNIAKQFNAGDLDELLNNAQKILTFLEYYVGDCDNELSEKKEKFIDVVNDRLNKFDYKDSLKKEYARHAIVSEYINNRLGQEMIKVCKKIDSEIGEDYSKIDSEYKPIDKLSKVYIEGLVPSGEHNAVFSSRDYQSTYNEQESNDSVYSKSDIFLTEREEIDKKMIKELIENIPQDIKSNTNPKSLTPLVDIFIKARNEVSQIPMIINSPNIKPDDDIRSIEKECLLKMFEISKE